MAPERRDLGLADMLLTGGKRTATFNKTLQDGYLASLENDIRRDIADQAQRNPDNLTGFNSQMEGYSKGILDGVDPAVREPVRRFLDSQLTSARISIQGNSLQRAEREADSEIASAIESAGIQAAREARAGKPIASAEALQDAAAHIDSQVERGRISPQQAARQKRELEREATEQGFRFQLDATAESQGIDAAQQQLDTLAKTVPKGWTPDEWDTFITSAQTDLNRLKSRQNAARTETNREALNALQDFEKATANGFEVSPQETSRVANLVQGDPELQKRFGIAQRSGAFAVQSKADRDAQLNQLETGELEDVDEFVALNKSNAAINRAALEDGYSLGVGQGLITPVDFQIDNPDTFQVKVEQAQQLSQHYGVPVSPLTDGEAQLLAENLPQLTIAEKVQLATTLSSAPEVWGQIDSKNAGLFAIAGASGDTNLMNEVFTGEDLLNRGLAKPIKPADYLEDFNNAVEGVYGSEDAQNILQATIAHYAATSGNVDGLYKGRAFERSLQAVTGGLGEVNDFKVQLPRGVSEDDFQDFVDTLQPETIAELGGVSGVSDERAAELIKRGRIQSVKDDQYVVLLDNGALFSGEDPTQPFFLTWDPDLAASNQALAKTRRQAELAEIRQRRREQQAPTAERGL